MLEPHLLLGSAAHPQEAETVGTILGILLPPAGDGRRSQRSEDGKAQDFVSFYCYHFI